MPRITLSLIALTILFAFIACDKETTEDDDAPQSSWTSGGVSYKEGSNPTTFSSGSLSASDNNLNSSIGIQFGSRPGPGSYSSTDLSDTAVLGGGNKCSIDLNAGSKNYKSYDGSVQVSNNGGKLTVTFTNVKMKGINSPALLTTVSGTLIEQ